jgi:hypothetical protein
MYMIRVFLALSVIGGASGMVLERRVRQVSERCKGRDQAQVETRCHAASFRNPSHSVRNPTIWFKLGIIGDAGPEITNGLGAFLCVVRSRPGFGGAHKPYSFIRLPCSSSA